METSTINKIIKGKKQKLKEIPEDRKKYEDSDGIKWNWKFTVRRFLESAIDVGEDVYSSTSRSILEF